MAGALPKQNKRKTDLRKNVGRFFMRVSLPMGGRHDQWADFAQP